MGAAPVAGDTTGGVNNLSFPSNSCPGVTAARGGASSDDAYLFQPSVSGSYTFELTAGTGYDPVLYVVGDCGDTATSCLGAADVGYSGDGETLEVALTAGESYWVVVDGWNNSTAEDGSYTLAASEACVPDCGGRVCGDSCGISCGSCDAGQMCDANGQCVDGADGESCMAPFEIDSLPFSVTGGDTSSANNNHSFPADACPGENFARGGASSDHVYRLTAESSGTYIVSVSTSFDPVLYAFTTCGDAAGSCVGAVDDIGGDDELFLTLDAGTVVFIVVDGWSNTTNQSGTYDLDVTGP